MPKSIDEYLSQLRDALRGADPALRQDALYDAEEYLRAEVAAQPGRPESEVIAGIVSSYGAPEEVAEVYRQTEETVNRAMRTPRPSPGGGILSAIFGVYADPRTYSSLFYMGLSIITGIFYFTWTVTGLAMSAGMMVLIIGLPFFLLFLGSTRLFSLIEGRIVETFLGVRMPRRPVYQAQGRGLMQRIGDMITDVRTWSTMLYMVLMLPLGIAYFTFAVTTLSTSLALMLAPITAWFEDDFYDHPSLLHIGHLHLHYYDASWWQLLLVSLVGFGLVTLSMHLYRAIGRFQGHIARGLLVKLDD